MPPLQKDSSKWEGEEDRYGWMFKANTYLSAATHQINLGNKTMLRSAVAWSKFGTISTTIYGRQHESQVVYEEKQFHQKITASSTLNHRFNNRNTLRSGVIVNFIDFDYFQKERANPNAPVTTTIDADGKTQTLQAFAQWQSKLSDKLMFNAGLHYFTLLLNNIMSVEPRASVRYNVSRTATYLWATVCTAKCRRWEFILANSPEHLMGSSPIRILILQNHHTMCCLIVSNWAPICA